MLSVFKIMLLITYKTAVTLRDLSESRQKFYDPNVGDGGQSR